MNDQFYFFHWHGFFIFFFWRTFLVWNKYQIIYFERVGKIGAKGWKNISKLVKRSVVNGRKYLPCLFEPVINLQILFKFLFVFIKCILNRLYRLQIDQCFIIRWKKNTQNENKAVKLMALNLSKSVWKMFPTYYSSHSNVTQAS